jgi:pimeloyl-ACP methyl ester carboxylesterase
MAESQSSAAADAAQNGREGRAATPKKKRAVILIHGIGNQTPMETLRPFVEAVWTSLSKPGGPPPKHRTWSQRDLKSDNLELWRITTDADANEIRTDFFEFYWADMMEDTRLSSVTSWIRHLFLRGPGLVPPAMMGPSVAGWVGIALLLVIFLIGSFLGQRTLSLSSIGTAVSGLVAAAIYVWFGYLKNGVLIPFVGDAARYFTPAPSNIGARTRIRLAGLNLLRALHCDNAYDRIIVVGHSLGTAVGYDLLNFYWSDINDKIHHDPKGKALVAVENAGRDVRNDPAKLPEFQKAQHDYFHGVRRLVPDKWKISDFVTLGSPLTYAHLLMVDDRQQLLESEKHAIAARWLAPWWKQLDEKTNRIAAMFRARAAQRELPLCPPITEKGDEFTYDPGTGGFVVPHHAAVFAAVRWTNIYAPCRFVFKGDVIGGPVAPLFGPGVNDVALDGEVGKMWLAHTHYWDEGRKDDKHLVTLRNALDF